MAELTIVPGPRGGAEPRGSGPVSVPDAAAALGIGERAVRKRLEKGQFAGVRDAGGRWMVWLPEDATGGGDGAPAAVGNPQPPGDGTGTPPRNHEADPAPPAPEPGPARVPTAQRDARAARGGPPGAAVVREPSLDAALGLAERLRADNAELRRELSGLHERHRTDVEELQRQRAYLSAELGHATGRLASLDAARKALPAGDAPTERGSGASVAPPERLGLVGRLLARWGR